MSNTRLVDGTPVICKKDVCLATCQMNVLNVVLTMGGMSMEQAIVELALAEEKYAMLADIDGLQEVARAIRRVVSDKQYSGS